MSHLTRVRSFAFITAFLMVALAAAMFTGSSPARAQTDMSVDIVDFGFSDAAITIEAGSTVTWTNTGATTHTVTADGGEFDSGDLAPGESFSFTFDTPGTFSYTCTIHPQMTGSVTVTEAGDGGTTDGSTNGGTTEMPDTGSGTPMQNQPAYQMLIALVALTFAGGYLLKRSSNR